MRTWPALDRFMASWVEDENGCWIWQRSVNNRGYGCFTDASNQGRRLVGAHRWSYLRFNGPIADGLTIDHLCRNRACVNPDHLEAVSHLENVRRGERATATHCKRGHEYNDENSSIYSGWRKCNICNNEARRLRRAAA